jgi:hypothetical protein
VARNESHRLTFGMSSQGIRSASNWSGLATATLTQPTPNRLHRYRDFRLTTFLPDLDLRNADCSFVPTRFFPTLPISVGRSLTAAF